MKQKRFYLYAIHGISHEWADPDPFDIKQLPCEIAEGVTLEDVSPFINKRAFRVWEKMIGESNTESMQRVHYALVYRYEVDPSRLEEERLKEKRAKFLLRNLAALLRVIRPMRQGAGEIHGSIRRNRTFDVHGFIHPTDLMEVPEIQKNFSLRNQDLTDLKKCAPEFLRLMAENSDYWKFRMAIQFHEGGHWADSFWKGRFILWCSAIEALFTSSSGFENKGSLVATERIKWFLGKDTSIHQPSDFPKLRNLPKPLPLSEVVGELYNLRNLVAHGERVPDHFHTNLGRAGVGGAHVSKGDVLIEAASFIIRASILKILRDGLADHFKGSAESDAYFGKEGLTKTKLRKAK